jgi:2-polyprenyl-6-methoxyphenol hydroxylase-like FAD-dependent oxidoreductase
VPDISCDIAIMGGGPAGTTCAISLRLNFPQWEVAVFEASDYSRPRPGEILPAQAISLLRQLRVPLDTFSGSSLAAEAMVSAWGQDDLIEQHHLFSARGAGLHLCSLRRVNDHGHFSIAEHK